MCNLSIEEAGDELIARLCVCLQEFKDLKQK